MKSQFYRTCKVKNGDGEFFAIFHRFEKVSTLVAYTCEGRHDYAVESKVIGIVEDRAGQIKKVDAEDICFLDGFSDRIITNFFKKLDEEELARKEAELMNTIIENDFENQDRAGW